MSLFTKTIQLLATLGPRWLLFRLWYALKLKSGYLPWRTPCASWAEPPTDELTGAHFAGSAASDLALGASVVRQADAILAGRFCYFSRHRLESGFPPDWSANPFAETAKGKPGSLAHWSHIGDFSAGDIKGVWELNRFAFAYPLIRAWRVTGEEKYAEGFWQLLESWREANPPNCGVNWKCGQEIALRLLAWSYGGYALGKAEATTASRNARLSEMIAVSAERIEATIDYALSQQNNHGISEATGLWTAGLLLKRDRWVRLGRRLLEAQARSLIYDDGAFAQHSLNYHRVMLHDYLWAIQLGRANGEELSPTLIDRVRQAGEFLQTMLDPATGHVPNLGSNDGALVLPLSNCDYRDFRPTVQAAAVITTGKTTLPSGAWDELWIGLGVQTAAGEVPQSQNSTSDAQRPRLPLRSIRRSTFAVRRSRLPFRSIRRSTFAVRRSSVPCESAPIVLTHFAIGGYVNLQRPESRLLLRCPQRFRHRPHHCDLLHVDLWHRGCNIFRDAGTYSYNCAPPWNSYFKGTAAHNTIQFDGHEQMPEISRFLYGAWPQGEIAVSDTGEHLLDASYRDWQGCWHHRQLGTMDTGWIITDSICGHRKKAVLRWRLAPELSWELADDTCRSEGATVTVTSDDPSARLTLERGWESHYYLDKSEIRVLTLTVGTTCRKITTAVQWTGLE
jgi:hypothetical protein